MNYYNEIDAFAAAWLRELIREGLIPEGHVDERDIRDVQSSDLNGYVQHHWFCGIAGWSRALQLAGWPADRPVWTGSCPCQPFSVAGRRGGFDDPRHLWPSWERLIAQCHPPVVFGEQVARAPAWLALVRGDLEALDYAVGCMPIEAASAGAYHFRDRYFFVADCDSERSQVAISERSDISTQRETSAGNSLCDVDDAARFGWGEGWSDDELWRWGPAAAVSSVDGCQIVECPDGKWRRLPPPRVRWLGTRIPSRVDIVRGIGNAIDPRPAAEFIRAYLDAAANLP